MIKQESAFVGR